MKNILAKLPIAGLSLLAVTMMPHSSWAECPCSKGASPFPPHIKQAFPQRIMPQQVMPQQMVPRGPLVSPPQISAATPPGTIGQTYYRASREVPADKHPRIAMVDIIAPGATEVALYNINPHREEDAVDGFENMLTNGLWQFETKPLIPGVPHIYKAVFKFSDAPGAPETVRYIRLIPGRIVSLTY